jgi:hypothetical protein
VTVGAVTDGVMSEQVSSDRVGTRQRVRLIVARVVTVAAGMLLLAALLLPNQFAHLTLASFLRIPLEGLLAVGLVLLLPVAGRRVAAVVAGVLVGALAILKVLDMGFFSILARPFDPVLDWPLLAAAMGFLTEQAGRAGAVAAAVAAGVLTVVVLVLAALSALRLSGALARHRRPVAATATALGVVWIACLLVGVQIVPGVPVASHEYDRVLQVGTSLRDRQAFAAEASVDGFRDTPGEDLLTALRGKDVIVAFVESYGRDAVEDPELAPPVVAVLADGQQRLEAAGFEARSGFLTSPTAGGVSWLAHATLLSGLWVDNQQRYRTLVSSDRLTLNRAFQRAGWRTVGVMPGIFETWPEGAFYGYDQVYDHHDLGYRGPRMNWGVIPDQYTMAAFERAERSGRAGPRPPVMAEIALLSSHVPWTPVAPMVDWDGVRDGSVFGTGPATGHPAEEVLRDPERVRAAYGQAVAYSLTTLISYVETYGDDDLVLVFLGDHQPAAMITGEDASRDVPVTIVTRDPAVLDRVAEWGWDDGLRPGPRASVWPMDEFRDRFLAAFGPRSGS